MEKKRKEFSKIYDNYIDRIYRFIFLKVSSEEIAQDLCSETFMKGWLAFQKNQGSEQEIQNIQAFLYKIARNLITDHYREKGRTEIVPVEATPIVDPEGNLEEKAMMKSDIDNIRTALVNLKEEYQNMIIWYYLDDLPISEIAKISEKSEGAVRVQLHRALEALRSAVKEA